MSNKDDDEEEEEEEEDDDEEEEDKDKVDSDKPEKETDSEEQSVTKDILVPAAPVARKVAEKKPKAPAAPRPLSRTELQYLHVQPVTFRCLAEANPLRAACLFLTRNIWFEHFITLCVFVNIAILASFDPEDYLDESSRNKVNNISEPIFTAIFSFEMVVKMIALGFFGGTGVEDVKGPPGYFNDGFNVLDSIIVLLCYVTLTPGAGNIQSMRTLRILRSLRVLRTLKSMSKTFQPVNIALSTILDVVPQMLNVSYVFLFFILTFGMFSLMIFPGAMKNTCSYPKTIGNSVTWLNTLTPCSLDCSSPWAPADSCIETEGDSCPSFYLGGATKIPGVCRPTIDPDLGYSNFNHLGTSMLTTFTIITMEGWSAIEFRLWHSFGAKVFISLFLLFLIVLGLFLTNLFAAILLTNYSTVASTVREEGRKEEHLALIHSGKRSPYDLPTASIVASLSKAALPPPPLPPPAVLPDVSGAEKEKEGDIVITTNPMIAQATVNKTSSPTTTVDAEEAPGFFSSLVSSFCNVWDGLPCLVPDFVRSKLLYFSNHWAFGTFMTLVIIANALLLACETTNQTDSKLKSMDIANLVFVALFTAEFVLKVIALGIKEYMASTFNVFDGIIVIISIIEAIIGIVQPSLLEGGGASALRAFRLLRVLKMAKAWKRLERVLLAVSSVVPTASATILLMFVSVLVFSLMGMQLFGGKELGELVTDGDLPAVPRANYRNLWWAIVSSFWVMSVENWNYVLYAHMVAFGPASFLFFIAMVLLGYYVFGNLFLATILDGVGPGGLAEASAAAANEEKVEGGLPGMAYEALRWTLRFWGGECRDRCPQGGKCFGYCRFCDVLEDDVSGKEGAVEMSKIEHCIAGADKPKKLDEPSDIPIELLPIDPPSSTRVDYIENQPRGEGGRNNGMAGAVFYVPPTFDPRPPKSIFADPDDPETTPPIVSAGMRIQVLASGDVRVIPQAAERLPADIPLVRLKQYERGELITIEEENKARDAGGRERKKWRRGIGYFGEQIVKKIGRANYDWLLSIGRSLGFIAPLKIEDDVLAQISDEQLQKEADLAGVKLKLFVRKTVPPKNLRNPTPHEVFGFILFDSPIREWAIALSSNVWLERLTILIILISTINLALAEPWTFTCDKWKDEKCRSMVNYLEGMDVFITIYFCFELLLKCTAQGLIFDDNAYLVDSWNQLDFAIVIISILSLAIDNSSVRGLRAFRALRALRPLRMVSRLPALKLVVNVFLESATKVTEVCLISFIFMFIFAVIGIQNFKGSIAACNDPLSLTIDSCNGLYTAIGQSCYLLPSTIDQNACLAQSDQYSTTNFTVARTWQSFPRNYDNFGNSLLTVWELSISEDWTSRMIEAVDAVGENLPMKRDANPAAALYFIVIQLVMGWTLFSFFTIAVFDTYNDIKSNGQGTKLLTKSQRVWVDNVRNILLARPQPKIKPLVPFLYNLVTDVHFEWTIITMIVLNVIALACSHFGMSSDFVDRIEYANYIFTIVFALEAILKLLAMGWNQYIVDPWHKFDFFLVLAAIASAVVSIIASASGTKLGGTPIATLLRILRLARLFRIVKSNAGLQRVVRAIIYAIPQLFNVMGIIMLLWFIFSIVGMQVLSGTRHGHWAAFAYREGQTQPWLNDDSNFDSFPIAFMTTFRITTGDDFNGIMRDLMVQAPNCIPNENCGDLVIPPLFFILTHFLTTLIAIKLYTVVATDAYLVIMANDNDNAGIYKLTTPMIEQFQEAWTNIDTTASLWLSKKDVERVVLAVPRPLGVLDSKNSSESTKNAEELVSSLPVVSDGAGKMQFYAVLHALAAKASFEGRCAGAVLGAAGVWRHGEGMTGSKVIGEITAITKVQALFRGKRERKQGIKKEEEF